MSGLEVTAFHEIIVEKNVTYDKIEHNMEVFALDNIQRILLKLSGEALSGGKSHGFDEATCLSVGRQVKSNC